MNSPVRIRAKRAGMIPLYIVLCALAFFFLFPLVFMFISSLKTSPLQLISDMSSLRGFIPYGEIGLGNYTAVFRLSFLHFFRNSLWILLCTVCMGLIVNSMIAYALSRLRFPGQNLLLGIIIALMIIPNETVVIPLLLMMNRFGLLDTYTVQILPYIADAFSIFLFYQFFLGIPRELDEAAKIDGAGYGTIYLSIIIPLARPIAVTVAILQSIRCWGEFLWPLMVTREEQVRPLPVAIQQLFSFDPKPWGEIFAFSTLITVPVLVIFLLFQKSFIRSVATSGLKG